MAKLARFAVLTLACLSFVAITYAQTDLVRSLAVRPAATIEELQLQAPELFEQEINALQQNATGPAVLTVGDSITAFGYSSDGWVSLLQQDYSHVTFVVSANLWLLLLLLLQQLLTGVIHTERHFL